MFRLLLRALSNLKMNWAVLLYHRRFGKKPKDIFDIFNRWQAETELSRVITEKIRFMNSLPDGFFLDIGIVLDIWDYGVDRWPLSALLQTAKHYDVTPEETLANYQIIVTPHDDYHGKVWARRIVQLC